jgi:hypothetical protein
VADTVAPTAVQSETLEHATVSGDPDSAWTLQAEPPLAVATITYGPFPNWLAP